jgi:hypothetical protein
MKHEDDHVCWILRIWKAKVAVCLKLMFWNLSDRLGKTTSIFSASHILIDIQSQKLQCRCSECAMWFFGKVGTVYTGKEDGPGQIWAGQHRQNFSSWDIIWAHFPCWKLLLFCRNKLLRGRRLFAGKFSKLRIFKVKHKVLIISG